MKTSVQTIFYKYLFLLIFLYTPVYAQEMSFAGTIDGRHAVHMFLDARAGKAEALYFYDRVGAPIFVSGGMATGKFVIGNEAEQFSGMIGDNSISGTWTDKKKKRSMPFSLQRVETGFSGLTGNFKCEAVIRGVEQSATTSLNMQIKAGQISRFEIESVMMPAAHSCNPDHSKFSQTVKNGRPYLESTADADQRCPISMRRAGMFVLVKTEGGACLCGARASIPDVLLNIKTGRCTVAQ